MFCGGEGGARRRPDTPGGGIVCRKIGEDFLESFELLPEFVVGGVGDLRAVIYIVETVMSVYLLLELEDPLFRRTLIHTIPVSVPHKLRR